MHSTDLRAGTPDRWDWALVGFLVALTAVALAGFALFSTNLSLLNAIPGAAKVYGHMFVLAPRLQIVVAFVCLAVFLARRVGAAWLPALGALYAISLGSELAGTTVGLPFGPYHYTSGLGPKLFGHVPVLIPLSWFFMALPAYALAADRFPGTRRAVQRVLLASFLLTSWDLVLDPAMSFVTKYWIWGTEGPYYGMPLLNLAGWYVTGLALMAALSLLGVDRWTARLDPRWLWWYYGANLLLPAGMCAAAGHWGALLAGAVAIGGCAVVMRSSEARVVVRAT